MRASVIALGLGLGFGVAEADVDDAATLTPSSIHATLDGTQAHLVARYGHRVHGADQNELHLALPSEAVITGATVTVEGVAHRLALMKVDDANDALDAIAKADPTSSRRWGVVISTSLAQPSATILAPRDAWASIDLELSMPTCFHADARYAAIPADWAGALDVALRARPVPDAARDACRATDRDGAGDRLVAFPSRELATRPPGEPRIGIAAGRLPLQPLHLARVELDLAATLTAVPADLATAFVIDGSRSVDGADLEAERRVVLSYLAHAPRSRVQLIAYARTAQAILPAWSLASHVAPRVDRELRALVTHNGSNLDVGLAEAATWLRRVEGTRRVVLFTDERLADAVAKIPEAALAKLLPSGTLVHVVAIDGASDTLVRAPEATFAELAAMTEGIAVRGGILDGGTGDAELLARPISLDDVIVTAPGWEASTATCSTEPEGTPVLAEGGACTWWWEGTAVSGPITIAGRLWGHPITRMVRPDPTRAIALARELQPHAGFDEPIKDQIMDAAHAVNDRWSLFGAWGGRGGYSDLPEGGGSFGGSFCGCDGFGTMGGGFGTGTIGKIEPFTLESQLRNGLRACNVRNDRVEVTIETTLQEIVALRVKVVEGSTSVGSATSLAAKQACAEDALWNVPLALQDPPFHATAELVL